MMRQSTILLFALAACVAAQSTYLTHGTITGGVFGEDGTAIVGASVTLRLDKSSSRIQQTEWGVKTGTGGAFSFEGLPQGSYVFCAAVPNTTWLNPCEWGLSVPSASLSNISPDAKVTITLKKGGAVRVRISDAGSLLSQFEGKASGARLLLGLGAPGFVFRLIPLVSQDSAGRNHQIIVPYNMPVNVVVRSTFFQVSDAIGVPLAKTGATVIPVTLQTGTSLAAIEFKVTGTAQ